MRVSAYVSEGVCVSICVGVCLYVSVCLCLRMRVCLPVCVGACVCGCLSARSTSWYMIVSKTSLVVTATRIYIGLYFCSCLYLVVRFTK